MKLFVLMLLLTSSIFAQDFVKVDENDKAVFYVDKLSIVKEKEFLKFTGKVETKAYTSFTDFITDCEGYVTLRERFETPEFIITRVPRKSEAHVATAGSPMETALLYVCTNTLKKSKPRVTVPQAE